MNWRCFVGYLFVEIPQWSSFSKPSSPRTYFEHKENEKDPNLVKPVKARSPAVSSSKGSKNFMSPTISAALKAISASSRKKILQERNDIMGSIFDPVEFPMKEEGVGIDEVRSKSATGFCSHEVLGGGELKKGESKIKKHQTVVIPFLLPSLPPYDPKANYLSPRPQFLHYRASPQTQYYVNEEGELLDVRDGRRLKDSFSLESSKDDETVFTEKDSKDDELPHKGEVEQSEIHITQPEDKSEPFNRQPFGRSRLAPLLLVMFMACLYAPLWDSPIISSSSILQDQSIPKLYTPSYCVFVDLHLGDYLTISNVNLQGIANRFRHWSTDCITYFTSVVSPTKDDFGLYHLDNMTSSDADKTVCLDLCYEHESESPPAIKDIEEEEIKVSGFVRESATNMMGTDFVDQNTELVDKNDETEEINMGVKEAQFGAQSFQMEISEEVMDVNNVGNDMDKEIIEEDLKNHPNNEVLSNEEEVLKDYTQPNDEVMNTEEEVVKDFTQPNNEVMDTEEEVAKDFTQALDDLSVRPEVIGVQEDCSDVASIDHTQPKFFHVLKVLKPMTHISALGYSAATFGFLHKKQKQTLVFEKERPATKKVTSVPTTVKDSLNNEEIISDFGPSEVSSSWNYERTPRRTSAASSSISYGSFTTYEKLSVKKGCHDEEVVTPVRRSSRIRNLVTSP